MQTRKALAKLSRGDKVYSDHTNSGLYKNRQQFIDMYDQREREIIAKKAAGSVPLPFLETIGRKVAKLVDTPNDNLPVITRYDLYTGIRRIAERAPADTGLVRLASQLERAWHQDPLGTLNYGEVSGLVRLYKDQYPRSKVADAIEAECTRVGLHKLPVAKLARIASSINSQQDYDCAIAANGFAGSRVEQVRARALIRDLVAMRCAVTLPEQETKRIDTRSVGERTADRITKMANMEKNAGYQEAIEILSQVDEVASSLVQLLDRASVNFFEDGVESSGNMAAELSDAINTWLGALTDARDNAMVLSQGQVDEAVSQANKPGLIDKAKQKLTPSKSEPQEPPEPSQLDEDMSDAGMTRKWYNPKTWFSRAHKAALNNVITTASKAAAYADTDYSNILLQFARQLRNVDKRMAQLDLSNIGPSDIMNDEPSEVKTKEVKPTKEPSSATTDSDMQVQDVDQGVDIIQEIEDVANDVIKEAPPDAIDYITHEKSEGHSAPPGTAEWGAEEILNEGHSAPPPSDEWLQEEKKELGMNASKGKGIPLPSGKISQQPNADSSDVDVASDGGTTLKASQIEDALLDGQVVRNKTGSIKILINSNDEVELWDKTSGRACDIEHLDTAIADFISLVNFERRRASRTKTTNIIDVPCEHCASINPFPYTSRESDQYACDCGHLIDASVVSGLVKMGYLKIRKVSQELFSMSNSQHGQLAQQILDNIDNLNDWQAITRAVLDASDRDPTVDPDVLLNWCKIMAPKIQQMTNNQQRILEPPTQDEPDLELNDWRSPSQQRRSQLQSPADAGEDGQVTNMPVVDVIKAAFTNYKAQGMSLPDALRTFLKEHADLVEQKWTPDADAALVSMQTEYYTASSVADQQIDQPIQPAILMSAQKVLEPKVNKPSDCVPVKSKPLGSDMEGKDVLPSPGTIEVQKGSPQGKLPDTDLGSDSDNRDINLAKSNKKPSKVKLPDTDLGRDSESNDGFKV